MVEIRTLSQREKKLNEIPARPYNTDLVEDPTSLCAKSTILLIE